MRKVLPTWIAWLLLFCPMLDGLAEAQDSPLVDQPSPVLVIEPTVFEGIVSAPAEEQNDVAFLKSELARQARLLEELSCKLQEESSGTSPSELQPAMTGKWDHGLWFATADGEFRANIGGRVEQDYVWFDNSPTIDAALGRQEDGFFFRRARIHGAGTMYGVIDLFAEFEAAPVDNIVFQDMWAQLKGIPLLGHFRAGHIKVPLGLENVTSAKYITFMERSAVHDAFQQEYDPGLMAWNYSPDKDWTWAIAWMRLDPNESGRAFGNGRYSGVARVTRLTQISDRRFLHNGIGFRYDNGGVQDPALGIDTIRLRARPELRNTRRFVDTGNLVGGGTSTIVAESAVVLGSFSAQAEYVYNTVHNATTLGGADIGNANFHGYQVYASLFLTGESRPYDATQGRFGRVLPATNVSPSNGNVFLQGAWEVALRYSHVDLNNSGIEGGLLDTVTSGATWYLNPNTKFMFNHIWARRDVSGSIGESQLFGTRAHISF